MMSADSCRLCSIQLVTKIEKIEHEFSLMHHIKMDQCKTNKVHRCSLCSITVGCLKNYVSHLNGTKHTKQLQWQRLQWKKRPPHDADIPMIVDTESEKKQKNKESRNSLNGRAKEKTPSKKNRDTSRPTSEDKGSRTEKSTSEKISPNQPSSDTRYQGGRHPVPIEKSQENQNYGFNSRPSNSTVVPPPSGHQQDSPFWQDSNQYMPFNQWDSQQIPNQHFNNFSNWNNAQRGRGGYNNNNIRHQYSWNRNNVPYFNNPQNYNPWQRNQFFNPPPPVGPQGLPPAHVGPQGLPPGHVGPQGLPSGHVGPQGLLETPSKEAVSEPMPPDVRKSQDVPSGNSRNTAQRSNEGSTSKSSSKKDVTPSRAFTDSSGHRTVRQRSDGGKNERQQKGSSSAERVSGKKRSRDQMETDRRRSDQGSSRKQSSESSSRSERNKDHVQVSGHRVSNIKMTVSRQEDRRIVSLSEKAKNSAEQTKKSSRKSSPKGSSPEPVIVKRKKKKLHNHTIFLSSDSGEGESEETCGPPTKKKKSLSESSSKDEISSCNQDLISRLVNFPRTRKQQQQLRKWVHEHARAKKRLILPRFNMQLATSAAGKDEDSVLEGMVCEVVGNLPDDAFKELVEALKKDRGLQPLEDGDRASKSNKQQDSSGLLPWLDFLKSLSSAPAPFDGVSEEQSAVSSASGNADGQAALPNVELETIPLLPGIHVKIEPEENTSDSAIINLPQSSPSPTPSILPLDAAPIIPPMQIKTEPPDPPSTDVLEPSNAAFVATEVVQCESDSAAPSQLPEPEFVRSFQQPVPHSVSPRTVCNSPRGLPPTSTSPRVTVPPPSASPRSVLPVSVSPRGTVPPKSASPLVVAGPSSCSGQEVERTTPGGNLPSIPAGEETNVSEEKPTSLQHEIVAQLVDVTKKEEELRGHLHGVEEILTQIHRVLNEFLARKNQMQREEVELRTRRIKLLETLQGFMTSGQSPTTYEDLLVPKASPFSLLPSIPENYTYLGTLESLQQLGMSFLNSGPLLGASAVLPEQQTKSGKKKKAAPKKVAAAKGGAKKNGTKTTKKKKKKQILETDAEFLNSLPTPMSLGIRADDGTEPSLGLEKLLERLIREGGSQKKPEDSSTAARSHGATSQEGEDQNSEDHFQFNFLPQEPEEEAFSDTFGPIVAHESAILDLRVCRGYLYTSSSDLMAKRLDIKNPSSCITYGKHGKTVSALQVTTLEGDRALVFTSSHDKFLRCFDAQSGSCLNEFDTGEPIICMAKGWGKLYLGLNNGNILPFSITSNRFLDTIVCSHTPISKIVTASEGSQRLLCVVAYDESVTIRNASTGLLLRCFQGRVKPPSFIQVSGNAMYVSTAEKKIIVHDLSSGNIERVIKCPSSSTGLCVIGEHILSCSYDGLIRCYRKKDWTLHALYYGAGKAMTMCMEVYEQWVYTGNRHGMLEGFLFDPTVVIPCRFLNCSYPFGRYNDLRHHLQQDHFPIVREGTKWDSCPWRGCDDIILKSSAKDLKEHLLLHSIGS